MALFDDLMAEGEPAIQRMIDAHQQEDVTLEFKTKSNPKNGEMDKADRSTLAEVTSAFANSMGGLLVWGVSAKKDAVTGIDSADAPLPIPDVARFKSDALRHISQAVMPRHEGVRIEAVPSISNQGAGYLLVEVGRSERRPHRAEFGDRYYFKRIGDSCVAMEHYDIEDAMKRQGAAELQLEVGYQQAMTVGGPGATRRQAHVSVIFYLANESGMSAENPYLLLSAGQHSVVAGGRFRADSHAGWCAINADPGTTVHPGVKERAAQFTVVVNLEVKADGRTYVTLATPVAPVLYKFGCLHARQKAGSYELDFKKLRDEVFPEAIVA